MELAVVVVANEASLPPEASQVVDGLRVCNKERPFGFSLLKTRLKRLSVLDREIRYILRIFKTFETF